MTYQKNPPIVPTRQIQYPCCSNVKLIPDAHKMQHMQQQQKKKVHARLNLFTKFHFFTYIHTVGYTNCRKHFHQHVIKSIIVINISKSPQIYPLTMHYTHDVQRRFLLSKRLNKII